MQERGGDHLRLPRVVASGRNAYDEQPFQASLASLDPGDGFVVGSMPLEHGPGDLAFAIGTLANRMPACAIRLLSKNWRETNRQRSPSLSSSDPLMGRSKQLFGLFLE